MSSLIWFWHYVTRLTDRHFTGVTNAARRSAFAPVVGQRVPSQYRKGQTQHEQNNRQQSFHVFSFCKICCWILSTVIKEHRFLRGVLQPSYPAGRTSAFTPRI